MSADRHGLRDLPLAVASRLALAGALTMAGCAPTTPTPTPAPTTTPAASADAFVVRWGGDVLLGDAAAPLLAENGFTWPFERIASFLEADYLVGNAEGPITTLADPYFPDQEFSYNADPAAAAALAEIGFDAMSLSNNHALDRGPDGLRDTIANLTDAGVAPFGAGSAGEATAPHLVETPYGVLAIVGLGERWSYGAEATPTEPGTVSITAQSVERAHAMAADVGARWVVAYVHWGENYSGVTDAQRTAARLFADAGYDLVIGHHPHVAQEVESIDGMPVLYSLGNLVFGTPGRFGSGEGFGLVATTRLNDGPIEIRLSCIVTDNDAVGFQPEPCTASEAEGLFARLGPEVRIEGQEAIVEDSGS
jgi:poly-gamma-glutamate synthesis protein (capsule biosynthesis protein)